MKFIDLENILIEGGAGSRAAECHGFLCGYMCISGQIQDDVLSHFLLAGNVDSTNQRECQAALIKLAAETGLRISADDYSLELLLPDDSLPLSDRGVALIQWCEGFLSGLGVAGLTDFDVLSPESRELIQDLYKICRLDVADIQDAGDDEEAAFMELTEYVRMGALLLYEEMQTDGMNTPVSAVVH